MRAMILSAGRGERMRPLTDKTPKALLSVSGIPLIVHHLINLAKAGIHEVVINLGHLGLQIKEYLGEGHRYHVEIHYSHEDPVLETGGGIVKALPFFGKDPFLVISADLYTNYSFSVLPKEPKGLAHIVLVDNPLHHLKGDYSLQEGFVDEWGEPKLNFGGIGVYRPELFADSIIEKFRLPDLFPKALKERKITGEHFKGVWHNIGTPEQLHTLNETLQQIETLR